MGSNGPPSPTHASVSSPDGVSSTPPSAPATLTATPLGEKGADGMLEKERERVLYPGRVTLTSEFTTRILLISCPLRCRRPHRSPVFASRLSPRAQGGGAVSRLFHMWRWTFNSQRLGVLLSI